MFTEIRRSFSAYPCLTSGAKARTSVAHRQPFATLRQLLKPFLPRRCRSRTEVEVHAPGSGQVGAFQDCRSLDLVIFPSESSRDARDDKR